jgi:hypothetical protein
MATDRVAFDPEDARVIKTHADPKGAAQDVRRFSKGQDVPAKNRDDTRLADSPKAKAFDSATQRAAARRISTQASP